MASMKRVLTYKELAEHMRNLYNGCLKVGCFLPKWKLVLIPKGGKSGDFHSSYRPICLLDKGKILERIIADRLVRNLSRIDLDLSED